MEKVSVHVEAEINPTEMEDRVKKAIEAIFGNTTMQFKSRPLRRGGLVSIEGKGLEALTRFHNLLRRERIRDAARKVFYEGLDGNIIRFCLNKQAAFAGHVSFSQEVAESPLGPIKVRIESESPRELIHWLTSRDDQRPYNESQ